MKNLVVCFIESEWYSLNIDDFTDFKKSIDYNLKNIIITFQTSDLIREFNSQDKKSLPIIIDLESFDKQMSQEGKEFRIYKNWKALTFLKYHKEIDSEFKLSKDGVKVFLEHLAQLYKKLLNKDDQENKRFFDIEIKINKLIYKRQKLGVRINLEKAKSRCSEIEQRIYFLKNDLQLKFNIFTPDNIEEQKFYLKNMKYRIINSLHYTFKVHRKNDEVCNLFYELKRSQQDLDSLIYIISHWGGQKRTYPSYYGFGTITSRIILRKPSLQNLRKSNRDIIIPDDGKKLMYIDYSQFEAGILASISNDVKLIALYNTDIYEDLAEKVLKNREERKEAKIIFYRYMYGDDTLNQEIKDYFKNFGELNKYKTQLEKELIDNRKIGTKFGNYRYSFEDNCIWSLSHVVQSTASYIYKTALLNVQKNIKAAEFIIPMHDGTVYQIDRELYETTKSDIEKIYKDEFKNVCPQIEPKLNCSENFE